MAAAEQHAPPLPGPAADGRHRIGAEYRRMRDEAEAMESRILGGSVSLDRDEEKMVAGVIRAIGREFAADLAMGQGGLTEARRKDMESRIQELCATLRAGDESRLRVRKGVLDTIFGLGPLTPLMADPEVENIIVQRWDNVIVGRNGRNEPSGVSFASEAQLKTIIERIMQDANVPFDIMHPIADAALDDGSRVNATHTAVSPHGCTLSIRRFTVAKMSADDYIKSRCIPKRLLAVLYTLVRARMNIIVSGSTNTGKTTFLNMLSGFIDESELIVTIEDTEELQLRSRNVRTMTSTGTGAGGVGMSDLIVAALRQCPDRIIVGEVRDDSINEYFDAAGTGHEGAMTSIHANNPTHLCNNRILSLYNYKGRGHYDESFVARQVAETVDVIVQLRLLRNGRRVVSHISAVEGVSQDGSVDVRDLFVYSAPGDEFRCTGHVPKRLLEKLEDRQFSIPAGTFDEGRVPWTT